MQKKSTSDRLKQIMKERNLKQVDILEKAQPYCQKYNVKLGKSDLSQFVSGKVEPGQWKLTVLGRALDVNEAWLMGYDVPMERMPVGQGTAIANNMALSLVGATDSLPAGRWEIPNGLATDEVYLIADYSKLNAKGKAKASERVKELTEVPRYIDPEADVHLSNEQPKLIEIDFYELPASAGTGMYLSDDLKTSIKVEDNYTARRADFVIPVSGDSMEPDYYDGDRVFVESMPSVEIGEVGIFVVNGDAYIKERGENELISRNKARGNISLCEGDTVFCMGKVIGKV